MTTEDHRDSEIRALRVRLSRMTEASRRINENLDFDTVLQDVLDSARTLIEARYGVITLFDAQGQIQEFLSSGLTAEEAANLWVLPEGLAVFNSLSQVQEPLRMTDFDSYLRSLGLPEFRAPMDVGPSIPLMVAPIRYKDETVGIFFVCEKEEGQGFTAEDEETLTMFASQAALVIVNARRYRDEQRARADLETLIDTSPVGVIVFDARTGVPTSFNREVDRILSRLQPAGPDFGGLMQSATIRRADGREVSLQDLSMVQVLSAGETVRAEEVVIAMPDGESVTLLLNATPILSRSGEIETFVVTLQDMTPVQEMERLRAEFLGMVSHELRTPLTSVKGSVATLLDPAAALNPAEMRQFLRIIDTQADRMRSLISDLLDVARIETGALSVSPEPADVAVLVNDARSSFVSTGGKHALEIDLEPDLPWVMADRPRMAQVLGNLIANAARHSPGNSLIRVSAVRDRYHVAVSVSDRGRGIPAENLPNLFRKFARLEADDQGGDTGLGLAICRGIVEAHGGRIWAESDGAGLGARFTFTIPVVEERGFVSPVLPPVRPSRLEEIPIPILAVDDDPQALRYVRDALSNAGYHAVGTGDPKQVTRLLDAEAPELVLLDLMLPGTDGIELMQEIREMYDIPVIFLSAYGQEELVARAFDMGAADYVVKPFSPTELAARIRAALRRHSAPEPVTSYVLGDLEINYAERRVTLSGSPVRLTAIEYRTLAELSTNAGTVVTYAQLLRRVWGEDQNADVRPMRTVISTLRRRLGDDADNPTYIFTEPRVGYRMAKAGGDAEQGSTEE